MENSVTTVTNSTFRRNFGYQGGVLFSEKGALITVQDSFFYDNFAF